ncbi:MAG: hypothetical protein IPK66_01185 [Rhodospirillales bacterium]|nr:hypothetical protein [Rhodospirillales bacterium]
MAGEWTVEQVAQQILKNQAKKSPVRTALLTGAGCSFQAGIPLARGFVDEIKKRFPDEYARAAEPTYPLCMAELAAGDRHELICEFIDNAKINWAHISIAQMMRAGFVDRVLTTNFDPLVMRACSLLNFYPAVYDMAVVRKGFVADFVRDRSVFHLHGQRDGFVQLHRKEEVDALATAIEPLFDDTARNRCWIVIGYSGANDPVFRALADRPEFPYRLFWVGFRDEEPSADVKATLLEAGKDVHWISGYDPDTFLVQLAARLGCFPPGFFAKPFSHLLECFETLAGFRLPGQDQELDWAARARGWIEQARAQFEAQKAEAAASHAAPPSPPPDAPPAAPAAPAAPELESMRSATGTAGIELELGRDAPPATPAPATPAPAEQAPVAASPSSSVDGDLIAEAWVAMMAGEHDRVIALAETGGASAAAAIDEPLAWSLAAKAKALVRQAATADDMARPKLQAQAEDLARRADAIRPGLGTAALAENGA